MHPISAEMRAAIDDCLRCYRTCQSMAMGHCLERGGRHVAPEHFRIMTACVEICRTSAHFMLTGTPFHKRVCAVCAEVCDACAKSCEDLDGMEECVADCRRCAKSCRKMAA